MVDLKFVMAGKAIFTINNPKGERYTYRVTLSPDKKVYFVGVLKGWDEVNRRNYAYIGLIKDGKILRTKGSKLEADSIEEKVFNWALKVIAIWTAKGENTMPEGYEIRHAGRCGRCGKLLTVPESIDSGIGPECAKVLAAA